MSREPAPYVVIAHPLVELVALDCCAIMTPGAGSEAALDLWQLSGRCLPPTLGRPERERVTKPTMRVASTRA